MGAHNGARKHKRFGHFVNLAFGSLGKSNDASACICAFSRCFNHCYHAINWAIRWLSGFCVKFPPKPEEGGKSMVVFCVPDIQLAKNQMSGRLPQNTRMNDTKSKRRRKWAQPGWLAANSKIKHDASFSFGFFLFFVEWFEQLLGWFEVYVV